ncbi:MAG: type II toxin-antitoxin system prevent-host-death family antitoxin [Rhodospirillales bacterium]|nr:type II toxin-antitoxin system prevent-host-death family antitoxin [Rhodospirillales bacterium]
MTSVTITDSEFDHDPDQAKREAQTGPVIITKRGEPAHVLLTWDSFRRLAGRDDETIIEALALTGVEDADFHPPRLDGPPQQALLD